MSIYKNLQTYTNDVIGNTQEIQKLMEDFPSGKALMEASRLLHISEEMRLLLQEQTSPNISMQNQILLGKYLDDLLQENAATGLAVYSTLLQLLVEDPAYSALGDSLTKISHAATALNEKAVFKNYVQACQLFEEDCSPEAMSAKNALDILGYKVREWTNLKI